MGYVQPHAQASVKIVVILVVQVLVVVDAPNSVETIAQNSVREDVAAIVVEVAEQFVPVIASQDVKKNVLWDAKVIVLMHVAMGVQQVAETYVAVNVHMDV